MNAKSIIKSYGFSILLICSILVGSLVGIRLEGKAVVLKPFGQVFLNALYVAVVPLIFFSIASAVASMLSTGRLLKILGLMLTIFVITGLIAALVMVAGVSFYKPAQSGHLPMTKELNAQPLGTADQIVGALTVGDFPELLSKRHVLPLILFAVLVGLAATSAGARGRPFVEFLVSANEVFAKVIRLVMYYAPVGLAAYFAYLVGVLGSDLLGEYLRVVYLYYPLTLAYMVAAFTLYAYLAGRGGGVRAFWKNIIPAAATAAGSGSSFAAIPLNLQAADKIGVPRDISETVIPMGATIHMDGSCMAAVLKIAFLFCVFDRPFEGFEVIATAVCIAILSGTVVSGIPGGGITGEILIVTMYGFPPEALPMINMIGNLVDPPATMINAVGDNVSSMMIARILHGRNWMKKALPAPAAAMESIEA